MFRTDILKKCAEKNALLMGWESTCYSSFEEDCRKIIDLGYEIGMSEFSLLSINQIFDNFIAKYYMDKSNNEFQTHNLLSLLSFVGYAQAKENDSLEEFTWSTLEKWANYEDTNIEKLTL